MTINRRQNSEVLFGDELSKKVPQIISPGYRCVLSGKDGEGNNAYIPLNDAVLSRHILLLGGIGTGKTNTFFQIISQLSPKLGENDVMFIFDTKGDFYREFYKPGDVVISNDSTATGDDGLDYWNIFNEIDYETGIMESVIEISKSLFAEACKKTSQIFFPNAAKDIFMACMLHFIRSKSPVERTNANLIRYINKSSARDFIQMLRMYDDLKAMESYIANPDSPQTQGVISELQQCVREVFIGNFAKTGTLSMKNLARAKGGRRVFIEYDLGIGKMLSPVYSLMFDMAIKSALGRSRTDGNTFFVTDEFRLLPNLEHIDDAVNFGRSLGIKFMIGIQNVEQIYECYGQERARSIMSGFLTNFMFKVNDAASRQYVQDFFGKNEKIETYMPTNQRNGIVEQQRTGNVVEDWDMTSLKIGQAIIGMPNVEPFVYTFDEYKPKM